MNASGNTANGVCAGVGTGDGGCDHARNLAGHAGVKTIAQDQRLVQVPATALEAAHVLLSSAERYAALQDVLGAGDLSAQVADRLDRHGFDGGITAETYWTLHRLAEVPPEA